jgi:3-phenylpropionate/cinnamic acid dioxygenase small subunit
MEDAVATRMAVQDVILQYAACIDELDFDSYRGCFSQDCEFVGFGSETIRGAERWIEFVKKTVEPFSATQHMLGPPQAQLAGELASLRTDLQAQHFLREPRGRIFTLWGTYRSDLERDSGTWRIRRHELVVRATRMSDAFKS